MRKLLTLGIFGALLSFGAKGQALSQGQSNIQLYYGIGPNIVKAFLEASIEGSSATNITVGSLGPIGLRYSYMVSDKAGVGLDANYTDTYMTYTDMDTTGAASYSYTVGARTMRFMPRFDFHFAGGDNFDAYFGIGAGYRTRIYYAESDDPNFVNDATEGVNPVAFRVAVGGQYFFSPNIGLNMEIGLGGGGLLRSGLAMKF